jgi:hypothetical protein
MATSEVVELERAQRALIYTRVSKDKRQGRSVEEQETECRRVCEHEGWTIADVLSDNDRSASRYATKTRTGSTCSLPGRRPAPTVISRSS